MFKAEGCHQGLCPHSLQGVFMVFVFSAGTGFFVFPCRYRILPFQQMQVLSNEPGKEAFRVFAHKVLTTCNATLKSRNRFFDAYFV